MVVELGFGVEIDKNVIFDPHVQYFSVEYVTIVIDVLALVVSPVSLPVVPIAVVEPSDSRNGVFPAG